MRLLPTPFSLLRRGHAAWRWLRDRSSFVLNRRSFLAQLTGVVFGSVFWKKKADAAGYNMGAFWQNSASPSPTPPASPSTSIPGGAPLSSGPWTIWTWGTNTYGQLGLGDVLSRSSPVQLGSSADWSSLSGGLGASFGVKTDGSLWAWGHNSFGSLGLGDSVARSSPVQVGSALDWKGALIEGPGSMYAVKTDGTLWTWGGNSLGQLGHGDIITRSAPAQVGGLTDWKQASGTWFNQQVASSPQGTGAAVKSDGTLWTWGHDLAMGCLGAGTTSVARSSPVAITGTGWARVSGGEYYFHAIKTDGSLWSWGKNTAGQLGTSDSVSRSVPTQVGTALDWAHVLAGVATSIALKTDGSIWVWGDATNGSLGNSQATVSVSSPIQVGTLSSWQRIQRAGYGQSGTTASTAFFCLQTNGSLWSWGDNSVDVMAPGQLGQGDVASRSSPTQIGTATTWKHVIGGGPGSQFGAT